MKLAAYLLYGSYTILWSQIHLANALVGQSVRAANENEYAGVVSIQLNSGRNEPLENHICTGALITNQDVVTAENCFDHKVLTSGYRISAGTTDLLRNSYLYPAWWITFLRSLRIGIFVRLPRYRENDIIVIRLTVQVRPEISISRPVYIRDRHLYGTKAMTTGWGKFPNGTTNHILQTVEVNFLQKNDCDARLSRARGEPIVLEFNIICSTSEPHATLTQGDFGGPVFRGYGLIGLNKDMRTLGQNITAGERMNFHLVIDEYRGYIRHLTEML